jgi:hypothetical protein
MTTMTTFRRALTALAAAGLLAATMTACGRAAASDLASATGDSGQDPQASPTATLSPEEAAQKFVACMREHGVDMEDPEISSGGEVNIQINGQDMDHSKVDAAMEACREYSPFGTHNGPAPDPAMQERMRQFAQCMRDHGVDAFPDPDDGTVRIDGSVADDPDFPAAQQTCQAQFMPDMPGPDSRTGGPGSGGGGGVITGGGPGGGTTA